MLLINNLNMNHKKKINNCKNRPCHECGRVPTLVDPQPNIDFDAVFFNY